MQSALLMWFFAVAFSSQAEQEVVLSKAVKLPLSHRASQTDPVRCNHNDYECRQYCKKILTCKRVINHKFDAT